MLKQFFPSKIKLMTKMPLSMMRSLDLLTSHKFVGVTVGGFGIFPQGLRKILHIIISFSNVDTNQSKETVETRTIICFNYHNEF